MLIINKTTNGQIFKCDDCDSIHIEFKNIGLNFSLKQFDRFADYISKLDGEKWESKNAKSSFKRKIIIPLGTKIFNFLATSEELLEFNKLLNPILGEEYSIALYPQRVIKKFG